MQDEIETRAQGKIEERVQGESKTRAQGKIEMRVQGKTVEWLHCMCCGCPSGRRARLEYKNTKAGQECPKDPPEFDVWHPDNDGLATNAEGLAIDADGLVKVGKRKPRRGRRQRGRG